MGRAGIMGGVAELWGHIRPPHAETGGKRQEAWTGERNQVSKTAFRDHLYLSEEGKPIYWQF